MTTTANPLIWSIEPALLNFHVRFTHLENVLKGIINNESCSIEDDTCLDRILSGIKFILKEIHISNYG